MTVAASMQKAVIAAAAALALAACASTGAGRAAPAGPEPAVLAGTWRFDFDAGPGVALATLTDAAGLIQASVRCQAPRGPIVVTDFALAPLAEDRSVSLSIGAWQTTTLGAQTTDSGRTAVRFSLPPQDPVFQAITAAAPVRVSTGARGHAWAPDAALQMNAVLNACIARGS